MCPLQKEPFRKIALDISHTSFIETYRIRAYYGVLRYAREHTNWQLIYNVDSFSLTHKFDQYTDLRRMGVDGLIFLNWFNVPLGEICAMGIPVVSITDVPADSCVASVLTDDHEVGAMAAQHFIERGFQNFAYCGSGELSWARHRLEGFRRALAGAHPGQPREPACFTYEQGPQVTRAYERDTADQLRAWLAELPRPLAVFAENDSRAYHVLETCKALELDVPGEVAILGVDNNVMICNSMLPSLSSIEQNTERVGYEAAALLDKMLVNPIHAHRKLVVPPKGVATRMSTDILAVEDPAVARGLAFIRDHLGESIGIDDVVAVSGVSRSTLEQRFRKLLGHTINHEIRRRRMSQVKMLLLNTSLTLDQIAAQTGFRRSTYLTNVFTEEMGESPGSWRRSYQNNLPQDHRYYESDAYARLLEHDPANADPGAGDEAS